VFCRKILAAYYRNAGRYREADRELIRALAIANERDFKDEIASLTIDRGRLFLDTSEYSEALKLLLEALGDGSGPDSTETRIQLGRLYVRLGDPTSAQKLLSKVLADLEGRSDSELLPALHLVMGELAYEMGQQGEARMHFEQGSAGWVDTLVDASSVEARASIGILDARLGRREQGRMAIQSSLEQARKMGQFALEIKCRLYLVRILLSEKKFGEALRHLDEIPAVGSNQTIGLELQAQISYLRGQALAGLGNRASAESEAAIANKSIRKLQNSLPEQYRERFLSRVEIRSLVQ
jgi:tetratricopeptide (TPR) repeat protein